MRFQCSFPSLPPAKPVLLVAGTGEGHQASWGKGWGHSQRQEKPPESRNKGQHEPQGWVWGSCAYHSPHYFISGAKNKPKQGPGGGLFLQLTEERQENSLGLFCQCQVSPSPAWGQQEHSEGAWHWEGSGCSQMGLTPSTSIGRAVGARAVNYSSRKQREMNRTCLGLIEPKTLPSFTPLLSCLLRIVSHTRHPGLFPGVLSDPLPALKGIY